MKPMDFAIACESRFNPSRPSDTWMREQIIPSLVPITICRLLGVNQLSQPVMTFCQLGTKKENVMKSQSVNNNLCTVI